MPLVPAIIDVAQGIPVVAAGGIGDGRGLAAALMLGAEGAWIGTRFLTSREWAGDEWVRQKVLEAGTDDTILTRTFDLATEAPFPETISNRVLRNDFTDAWHGRDEEIIANKSELRAQIARAAQAGDSRIASVNAGSVAGLISQIEPAGDILRRIVAEAEALLRTRPQSILSG